MSTVLCYSSLATDAHYCIYHILAPFQRYACVFNLLFPKEWYYEKYVGQGTAKAAFIKSIESNIIKKYYSGTGTNYETADQIAMALAIGDKVIKESTDAPCAVCLDGRITRGLMIVDWNNRMEKSVKTRIVTELDLNVYRQLLIEAMQ